MIEWQNEGNHLLFLQYNRHQNFQTRLKAKYLGLDQKLKF